LTFLDPEFEFVVLHPDHFLPDGSPLAVYDFTTQTAKSYVIASDQRLRESRDPNSPCLPPFHHSFEDRNAATSLNIFLVILNADIKLRCYFEMFAMAPMAPLPDDVLALMKCTMELVDLLYWTPAPSKLREQVVAAPFANRRQNLISPNPIKNHMKRVASSETGKMQDARQLLLSHHKRMKWFRDMDTNSRMAYGRAVTSGHGKLLLSLRTTQIIPFKPDRDYDPTLFDDAYPVNYGVSF